MSFFIFRRRWQQRPAHAAMRNIVTGSGTARPGRWTGTSGPALKHGQAWRAEPWLGVNIPDG